MLWAYSSKFFSGLYSLKTICINKVVDWTNVYSLWFCPQRELALRHTYIQWFNLSKDALNPGFILHTIQAKTWILITFGWATHHCAGFLHFQLLVHHGRAAAGHRDVEWGTGKVEPWAKELPRDGAAGAGYPDQRHPRWNRHGREETGGSYLWESKTGFRIQCLLYSGTADGTARAGGSNLSRVNVQRRSLSSLTAAQVSKDVIALFREGDLVDSVSDVAGLQQVAGIFTGFSTIGKPFDVVEQPVDHVRTWE